MTANNATLFTISDSSIRFSAVTVPNASEIKPNRSFAGWNGPDPRRPTLAALEHEFPSEVLRRSHTWGTSGWESTVRARPGQFALIITLHGNVVEHWEVKSRARALKMAQDAFGNVLYSVTAWFGDVLNALHPIHPSRWTSEATHDVVEARWQYQALTGFHVDLVNVLIITGMDPKVFWGLGRELRDTVAVDLVETFPGVQAASKGRPINRLLWADTPRADMASPEERERLLKSHWS